MPNSKKQKDPLIEAIYLFTFSRKQAKSFAFDHCFNSVDAGDSQFAGQEQVFQCLGHDILDNAFQGYNACIFAYGQTGKNKDVVMLLKLEGPRLQKLFWAVFYLNKTKKLVHDREQPSLNQSDNNLKPI